MRFAGIDAHPRPVQKPHPPIVVGGTSPAALRRAVARGNGWYGFCATSPTAQARPRRARAEAAKRDRPAALGALEITVTPLPRIDLDAALRYRDLGVDRLALLARTRATRRRSCAGWTRRPRRLVRKLAR